MDFRFIAIVGIVIESFGDEAFEAFECGDSASPLFGRCDRMIDRHVAQVQPIEFPCGEELPPGCERCSLSLRGR